MRIDRTWIYIILIGFILLFLLGSSMYENFLLKKDGVYAITHEFKKLRGTKSGVTYGYSFTTSSGLDIQGEYFKPITDKNAELKNYYVVYSQSKPTINVLLKKKKCCDNKEEVIFKRITKKEWSLLNF